MADAMTFTDKAQEFAKARTAHHKNRYVGEWVELKYPDFEDEIAAAFRAGEAQGQSDVGRRSSEIPEAP